MPPRDLITSPSNPHVRETARLRSASARRDSGLALVDGLREIERAVTAGVDLIELFVTADEPRRPSDAWVERIVSRGGTVTCLAPRAFERIAFGERNEGAVAVVRWRGRRMAEVRFREGTPVLVVEGVEKPGNLGAILRTADAAAVAGVIVAGGGTDLSNPACIRSSLGTVFAVTVAEATTAEAIAWCRDTGRRVVVATPDGEKLWYEARLAGSTSIVLGSEAHGLTDAWRHAAANGAIVMETIRLPMQGLADSLNLSATAAVLAYEAIRQEAAG